MSKGHGHSPKIEKAPDPEQATIEQNKGLSQMKQRNGLLSTMLGAKIGESSNANVNAYNFTGKEYASNIAEFEATHWKRPTGHGLFSSVFKKIYDKDRSKVENAVDVADTKETYNTGKKKNSKTSTSSILGTGEADGK